MNVSIQIINYIFLSALFHCTKYFIFLTSSPPSKQRPSADVYSKMTHHEQEEHLQPTHLASEVGELATLSMWSQ
jgi:hypothetical protein